MENNGIDALNQKGLLNELVEGRDLTMQLYSSLLKASSSSLDESNRLNVAQKILAKIESSLTLLRHESLLESSRNPIMGTIIDDSPISVNGSPKSSCSEGNFIKDSTSTDYKVVVGKRKVVPQHTLKVEGCRKSGLEGPIEDGFSWRKYGQKDIQRAKYPRAYYRCSQREQGCFATKQVQRSEHDPTSFQVTYRKNHTCYQAAFSSSPIPTNPKPKSEPTNASPPPQPLEILLCFETAVQDITTHLNSPFFPSHVASNHLNNANTQYTLTNLPNNNNNNNSNNNNNNTLVSPRVNNSLENLFDYGEIDRDFIFDDPRLFT